ncbi:cellulose biosynthesis protein BcsE [Legionella fallonii]|uniref:Cellulose biosynthesis protein BcsE n=1 Tax=Legionella fallonii LLAP-10 TaxID=1212491 RepID=A0A098GB42_9GAMM|nr:cellulose biosynthesis protein BcsE [Legionella fallonii]CEG58685.1 Cellulose biosynthesis protein BcsE [Legionella fallonii LLAP-10]
MTLSFSMGISQNWGALSMMQSPGFYWINADRTTDADQFCKQIIMAQSEDTNAALICQHEIPPSFLTDMTTLSIKKLPLFTMPTKKAAILHITTDLMRALKPQKRLLILLVNSSLWQLFTKHEIKVWIQKTSRWLNIEQSTLLLINHGLGSHQLQSHLFSQHRFLDGLSQLHWQEDFLQYSISWWATETGFTANQILSMNKDQQDWSMQPDNSQKSPLSQNDEFLYLADKKTLEGALPPSENWQLLDNNTLLVQQAERLQAATIIFSLSDSNQVDELAKQVHYLRCQCGDALKIVIREMSNNIRYSDERLLLACGANLTVPQTVSLPKFLTMLESIQGQRFNRFVPKNFDALLSAMHPIEQKGYLPVKQFSQIVLSRMYNTILPDNGKGLLVALMPEENVATEQALSLCDLKRSGDIVTITKNRLFLFLSTCAVSDLDTALSYIFQQPVNVIFTNHVAWDLDLQIISEIKQLELYCKSIEDKGETLPEQETKLQEPPVAVARRVPEPITLTINRNKRK